MRAVVVAVMALLATPGVAGATPWQSADRVVDRLFEAQTELVLSGPAAASRDVAQARAAYRGELRDGMGAVDPVVREALADAARAVRRDDQPGLAAARGTVRAALFRGAFAKTLGAAGGGDAATAKQWLLVREYRTATRFTRPGASATLALDQLGRGKIAAPAARAAVAKDLLDAYQARLRDLLADARRGIDQDLAVRRAEASAQAAGYFAILAGRYREDRGAAAESDASAAVAALPGSRDLGPALDRASAALEGFTAAPFTPEEAARRAQQLLRFLALVPVEYGRGVKGTQVHLDFEIQEAAAFRTGAVAAFADLRDQLAKRDAARTDVAAAGIDRLGRMVDVATKQKDGVAETDAVKAQAE